MHETIQADPTINPEAIQAEHDALVDMAPTLSAEEIATFNELVNDNREKAQRAKELGTVAFRQLPERPRDNFENSTLASNKEQALENDAIFYGNAVKRK